MDFSQIRPLPSSDDLFFPSVWFFFYAAVGWAGLLWPHPVGEDGGRSVHCGKTLSAAAQHTVRVNRLNIDFKKINKKNNSKYETVI